jgi:Gpi18-like mannosyltransferase
MREGADIHPVRIRTWTIRHLSERTPSTRTIVIRAALLFLLTRLFVFGVAYAWLMFDHGRHALGPLEQLWHGDPGGHGLAAEPWRRWDALWFMKTAREGYVFAPGAQSNTSIFPLYPMLMAALAKAGLGLVWAGVLISNLCLFGSSVLMLRLASDRIGLARASFAVAALLLFPCAFVLSGVYSESLFLFASLGAFYFAGRREWAEAGLCGFAAALTRFAGAALFIPLAVEFFANRRVGESRARSLWLLLVPLAPVVFFAFLQTSTGSFMNYFHAQSHWQKTVSMPWVGLGWELIPWPPGFAQAFNVASVGAFTALGIAAWRKFGASWGLYVLLGVLVPVCAARWIGMPRYMLVLFPAFVALAALVRKNMMQWACLAASAALFIFCFREFANWKLSF